MRTRLEPPSRLTQMGERVMVGPVARRPPQFMHVRRTPSIRVAFRQAVMRSTTGGLLCAGGLRSMSRDGPHHARHSTSECCPAARRGERIRQAVWRASPLELTIGRCPWSGVIACGPPQRADGRRRLVVLSGMHPPDAAPQAAGSEYSPRLGAHLLSGGCGSPARSRPSRKE